MRFVGKSFVAGIFILFTLGVGQHVVHAAATATVGPVYPASEVAIGTPVTFSIVTNGFTNPTYYLVDSFPGGATTINVDSSGDFSWTPNKDEVGTHTLTVTVSDSVGDSATASQTITVDGAASVAVQSLLPGTSVSAGVPVSFSAVASGILNPAYSVADSFPYSSMQSFAINAAGQFNWTPISQDIGTHVIVVTGKDIYGNLATTSTTVTVLPPPTITLAGFIPGTSVNVGSTLSFVVTTVGLISPAYSASDAFQGGSTSTVAFDASGRATWTPQYNDVGIHTFKIAAGDTGSRGATTTISITVLPQTASAAVPATVPATTTSTVPVQTIPKTTVSTAPPSAQTQTKTTQTSSAAQVNLPTEPTTFAAPFTQTSTATTSSSVSADSDSDYIPLDATETPIVIPNLTFGQYFFTSVSNFFTGIFSLFHL